MKMFITGFITGLIWLGGAYLAIEVFQANGASYAIGFATPLLLFQTWKAIDNTMI